MLYHKSVNDMKRLFTSFSKKKEKQIDAPIIFGENNKVIFRQNHEEIEINNSNYQYYLIGVKLKVIGNNNIIIIDSHSTFNNSSITIDNSNNGYLLIENHCNFQNLHIVAQMADNFNIRFAPHNRVHGSLSITCVEYNTGFISGFGTIYASDIKAKSGDAHTIFNKNTKEIINKPTKEITIGDNCWIGDNVLLTKNAQIPCNSILAMGSVVTKCFSDKYTIIGGNPAKVLRKDVNWSQFRISDFIKSFSEEDL